MSNLKPGDMLQKTLGALFCYKFNHLGGVANTESFEWVAATPTRVLVVPGELVVFVSSWETETGILRVHILHPTYGHCMVYLGSDAFANQFVLVEKSVCT